MVMQPRQTTVVAAVVAGVVVQARQTTVTVQAWVAVKGALQ